ncbi:carbohydrate ABC transporter permease [Actinoallomurus acaciae]|uniref:Carbohydrate ABC transporter permease n=1 Tax=Actinoallomurus acaciae TaxID=502577 RepID=A0ABV5YHW4_9ACTN
MAATTSATAPSRGDSSHPGSARGRKKPRRSYSVGRGAVPYLLVLPAIAMELLIHLVPMVVGVVMSFKELTQFYIRNWGQAPGAGLGNYRVIVNVNGAVGSALLHSFLITCAFAVLAVGFSWLLGITGAILMQDAFRGRGLLRALFMTPYALPVYASVIIWAFMLQHDNGLVNHVLHDQLHLTSKPAFWLIGNNSFVSVVVVSVWRNWPFALLVIMAGLQNIPDELYEASAIDGAGVWQQIRRITMPSLRPINRVLVLVLFLWTFNDFNVPYVLFGQSAPPAGDLISVHIYQASFHTWNFGSGSAMSVLMLLFLLVVTAAYLTVTSLSNRRSNV